MSDEPMSDEQEPTRLSSELEFITDDEDTFAPLGLRFVLGAGSQVTLRLQLAEERQLMHILIERAKARGEHLTL